MFLPITYLYLPILQVYNWQNIQIDLLKIGQILHIIQEIGYLDLGYCVYCIYI